MSSLPKLDTRPAVIAGLAAIVGILAGLVAQALYRLIALVSNLVFFQSVSTRLVGVTNHHLGWLVVIVPALGGLVVGVMAKYGTSKIRGHGIPEAMEAVLVNGSRIAPRVAILKPLSAAIAIGTGGPFGAEGPIIQTGGALGSILGQLIQTTAAERKVLLAAGAAAGMAATFGTPIAAVILAIELLLFEFRARSFIPLVIAATLATAIHEMAMGHGPMFKVAPVDFALVPGLPFYLALGVLCGLLAAGFSHLLYAVEDAFEALPVDPMWTPALGGLGLGLVGLVFPRVLGVGYDTITAVLNDQLPLMVLAGVAAFKAVALLVSLGSGTSGGLLAPMFMVGAAVGGLFAHLIDMAIPGAHLVPAAYALVAMAALFAAASRATFAFIVFAFEITANYDAILPLMLASVVASGIARCFMHHSIMTEKLARRGLQVRQDYEVDVFQRLTVDAVMDQKPATVPASMRLSALAAAITSGDQLLAGHQAWPVVDAAEKLVGIVTRGDVMRALDTGRTDDPEVLEIGTGRPAVTWADELLDDAIARMLERDVGRLPVVSRDDPARLVGYLGRAQVMRARLHRHHEERRREPGWLARARTNGAPVRR